MKKKRKAWNKGLTKGTDERVKKNALGTSKTRKSLYKEGRLIAKHKGKTKYNYEPLRKVSEKLMGRKLSDKHKKSLSRGQIKRKERDGYINSPEARKKFGKSISKEKHHNWRGGISFEPYGIEFNKELKEKIRKKYGYRCQQCFRHQNELFKKCKNGKFSRYKLHIHHIDYNKDNNSEENLIPLCNNCHTQTNYSREDWTNYFKEKMEVT